VNVEVPRGFIAPRLDEQTFSLGHPEVRPAFGCTLLSLQTCSSFPGGPQVDDFRHMNKRRYPDAYVGQTDVPSSLSNTPIPWHWIILAHPERQR